MKYKYRNNQLYVDGVALKSIVKKHGTPLYVYSYDTLRSNVLSYQKAFDSGKIPHMICYAMKANSNNAIVRSLEELGVGADIVSGGELFRAKKAGIPAKHIVYAGVGKTDEEIDAATRSNICMFNVESVSELNRINKIALKLKKRARISIRVNPDVNAKTHPHISTGLLENKFGIDIKEARQIYAYAKKLAGIKVAGVHMHIGSQILDVSPYHEALDKIMDLIEKLKNDGISLSYLNIGGGLGIPYHGEHQRITPQAFLSTLVPKLKKTGLTIVIEPGRSIVGETGLMVTKVLHTKRTDKKYFAIVDAGMNDLSRPSLYNAYHEIVPMQKYSRKKQKMDIVGPICESTDFLAKKRKLTDVKEGEYLVVKSVGAYGFSMASNYNSRLRAAEIFVKAKKAQLVRKRDTYRDLVEKEI